MIYYSALRLPDEVISKIVKFQKYIQLLFGLYDLKIESRYLHATFCFFGKNSINVTLNMKETIKTRIAELSENNRKASIGKLKTIKTQSGCLVVIDLNVSDAIKNLYEDLYKVFKIPKHKSPYEPSITIGKLKYDQNDNNIKRIVEEINSEHISGFLQSDFIIPGVKFII